MKYQIGDLIHYEDDDPIFDTFGEAEKHVIKTRQYADRPTGIWTDDGALIAIYHQGEFYTK